MTDPYDYSNTISKAASCARGDRLTPLYRLCENQKTISTSKLETMLDKLADDLKLDAIHFKALANKIRKESSSEN